MSIPITIGSLPVTAIGSGAFSNCTNLLMVTIPGGVASIEGSAFSGCAQLKSVLFEWNADSRFSTSSGDANVTVYYLPDTTGWDSTFCGVGTLLWNPVASGPAVHDNKFGFSIVGTTNIPVAIERCTDLAGGAWAIAQSGILTNGLLQFSDQSWTNNPRCFYRLCFPLPVNTKRACFALAALFDATISLIVCLVPSSSREAINHAPPTRRQGCRCQAITSPHCQIERQSWSYGSMASCR